MKAPPRLPDRRLTPVFAVVFALIATGVCLFLFNPESHNFYPKCVLYVITGLKCPACGSLRATHLLVHGHLISAFQMNPFFICLLPIAGWLALVWGVRRVTGHQWPYFFLRPVWGWALLVSAILFGVIRNIAGF